MSARARSDSTLRCVLVCLAAASATGCKAEEVHVAYLDFKEVDGGVSGFTCTESKPTLLSPAPPPLAQRALTKCGGNGRVTFVADVVSLAGGNPRCSPGALGEWCDAHACNPNAESRKCFERDIFDATTAEEAVVAISRELRGLGGTTITSNAPGESVLVRVIATTETCAEIQARPNADPFDCTRLMGCTYSCPVVPESAGGAIDMRLDLGLNLPQFERIYDQICLEGVYVCARNPVGTTDRCASRAAPLCSR